MKSEEFVKVLNKEERNFVIEINKNNGYPILK